MEELWFNMLIGIPGSGKSTWLNIQPRNSYVVCPDSIRQHLTGDISNQEQNELVWKSTEYVTHWALTNQLSVTLDATNTNTTLRRDFLSKLPQICFKRKAIVFQIDPDEAFVRTSYRMFGSKVPLEKIYRMYGDFLYTMKVLNEEDWDCIEMIGADNGGKNPQISESIGT